MTGKLLQAAQSALDALVQIDRVAPGPLGRNAMRVLREAIEQAREHSFFDTAETIEQALERNPIGCLSNCTTCEYNQASEIQSHGWCYMFRHEPQGVCKKHTGYTHPAQAQPAQPLTAEQVFKAIEHGDTEHRAWLRAALYALWDGLPVPAQYDQQALELCTKCGWKALIPGDGCLNCERVAQPAKPLTEEQIMQIPEYWTADGMGGLILFARAVEAAHGIKGQA
jgi:hypothetical protein